MDLRLLARFNRAFAVLVFIGSLVTALPVEAHHGKDFMLTSTDDMPLQGHIYPLVSEDDTFDPADSSRSNELTPGILFAIGPNSSLEPHLHFERNGGLHYGYGATAVEIRHRIGFIGSSEWRLAGSLEFERPKADVSNVEARVILVRQFTRSLLAANLVIGRDVSGPAPMRYGVIVGALRPVGPTDNVGVEVRASFPLADGVEILPGIYHVFGGPPGRASLKVGWGLFTSRATTGGTFHTAFIYRL